MNTRRFVVQIILLVLFITALGAAGIETVFYNVMAPTREDLIPMILIPLPYSILIVIVFLVYIFILGLPIISFLRKLETGKGVALEEAERVQEICLKYPYWLGFSGIFSFTLGATVIGWISLLKLGWPQETVIFGLLSGLIAGFFGVPLYIFPGHWILSPVLRAVSEACPELPPARKSGYSFGIQGKILLIVLCLVSASSGYMALVGYAQTKTILENQEKIEARLLSPEQRETFLLDEDDIVHATDPGIRSSRYYRSRLGNIHYFYGLLLFMLVVVATGVAVFASRSMLYPVRVLIASIARVQGGDYEERVKLVTDDEFGELAVNQNLMTEKILGQMKDILEMHEVLKRGVQSLEQTVRELLQISGEQSSAAAEQASSVQETGSVSKEIMVAAKNISTLAESVSELASKTTQSISNGEGKLNEASAGFSAVRDQVENIAEAMNKLEERFQQTYKIVELIDYIADQTELLSINAALEAAGAGVEGRRFAVVASETRRLAQRVGQAASDVKAMVEQIQKATSETNMIAKKGRERTVLAEKAINETIAALKEIQALAESTLNAAREIKSATGEQSRASEELVSSVSEIQEAAGNVEEGAKQVETSASQVKNFIETLKTTLEKQHIEM